MEFELLHPADQIVLMINRVYKYGMTTTSGGNLSVLDDNGDIWITPGGIDKGSLTRKDIIQVKPDGTLIGIHKPSVELPFHQLIYKSRADIKAVLHAHPPTLVAFSVARVIPNVMLLSNVTDVCGELAMAEYAVPGSTLLGEKIAKQFKKGANTIMMENHGAVIGASNLFQAFKAFETIDFSARLEINARRIGNIHSLTDQELAIYGEKGRHILDEFISVGYPSEERAFRYEMCDLIKRAYDQRLFASTQGTFSQRLSDDSFVITPYGLDRKYLEPTDLVKVKNGLREAGKKPSRSVNLHMEIYKQHPEINSVIISHPPAIMAFACSDAEFDARLIPESYIMLRDVPKYPFGSTFMQPALTAKSISSRHPVAIIENDCVVVAGSSLLNAFDRLEVLEYSAKAIISAKTLGNISPISQNEVDDIEDAFNLEK